MSTGERLPAPEVPATTRALAALVASRRERLFSIDALRRRRVLLGAGGAVVLLAASAAAVAIIVAPGPPARLVVDKSRFAVAPGGFLLLNNWKPVQLPVRVYDARGHRLDAAEVRYRRDTGVPVPVSPTGVITCTQRGDVVVRASLGPLVSRLQLRCDPIRHVRGGMMIFVLGDSARQLGFEAIGMDDRPVSQFAGELEVDDSTVAKLDGTRLRPLSAGRTGVELQAGDERGGSLVRVYEPVRTLAGLRADQSFVAAPVHLATGESVRWAVPLGLFWLDWLPARAGTPAPVMRVDGAIMCEPALAPGVESTHCLARSPGAWLTMAHPGSPTSVVAGWVALRRQQER